jgi:hypothetical protein
VKIEPFLCTYWYSRVTKCVWLSHSVQAEIMYRNISEFHYLNCLQVFCFIYGYWKILWSQYTRNCRLGNARVGPKVSGLTYKSRANWKMLRGIYSAIYGETILKNSKCMYIYIYIYIHAYIYIYMYWKIAKLFYFCHLKMLVRPETFGRTLV